jgi:hypothetical protein
MRDLKMTAALALLLAAAEAHGIKDRDNQGRWNKPTVNNVPDKEVPGFLVNLGPTGARAILTEKTFVVKYLFKGSPAEGKLRLDDVIGGAFGKPFPSHTFGGSPHGYEGPIMAFGEAIEKAEAKDGKLVLNVVRGTETIDIKIDLEPIGAFAAAFPMSCRKSELIRGRALKYLAESSDAQAVWQAHAKSAVTLALLSSEVPAQQAVGKRLALGWNGIPGPDTWTWGLSFQLITLAEYHLLTGDAAVLPTIKALAAQLKQAQYDGRILVWKAQPGEDPKKLDDHQQLYLGGFGHGPYVSGLDKNGYGPMQYTTIFAVIAWQLAERCGVKVDPRGLKIALEFIHRGTNAAGYVAYGGEFTLNAGFVDWVAWKKSTSGDNYVGRAGASIVAHKLSPEFQDSAEYASLNRDYLKKAYKSLPDGHADSNLGLLWGVMGAAASEDEAALRTVLDYHKAWFNMMRCHDGSFVLLPGRDYADDGYYMASRFHPTATMALVLGLSFPKLQVQGIQVSIPGVNPKILSGPLLAAYKAVVSKSYGQAARILKSAGPEAAPISAWLDAEARRVVDSLKTLETAGRWVRLKERLAELKKSHEGIPAFDEAAAGWEAMLKNSPILAADRLSSDGLHGKALAALGAAESPAARAVEERIRAAVREQLSRWAELETSGAWHAWRKDVDVNRERFRGIAEVDRKAVEADLALKTEPGRALIEADRRLEEGAAGPALKALEGLESPPAAALRARAQQAETKTLAELEALERDGLWHSLKEGLGRARPKLAGLAAFEERAKQWEAALASPEGRAKGEAEKSYLKGDLGAAWKGAPPPLRTRIEAAAREALKPLQEAAAQGDWLRVNRGLPPLRKKLGGVAVFDAQDETWTAAFGAEPAKSALRQGLAWERLRDSAGRRLSPALRKEIEAFAAQAGDGFYGREARSFLKSLPNS